MNISQEQKELFHEACKYMPGGVSSPVRAFKKVHGTPLFIKKGRGAYIYDTDNSSYLDFTSSWGPLLLGHAHPHIVKEIKKSVKNGTSFGTPTQGETNLAKRICNFIPSIEKLRFVNSGTEAAMSVARLVRAYTNRPYILKFEGCYHGHADSFLIKAGSGALTLGQPDSPGVPKEIASLTLVADYNNKESVDQIFKSYGEKIAAIFVEPIAGNMGLILPESGFLLKLRDICNRYKSLLVFDEVITGFRVGQGGAQTHYNIFPDITILGKIIGGGLPIAAYGGKSEYMNMIAPEGNVYQAGTLSGNPLATAAGNAVMDIISAKPIYSSLLKMTHYLKTKLKENFKEHNIPVVINQEASMFCVFFTKKEKISCFNDAMITDVELFKKYHLTHLKYGYYLPPSPYETCFISTAHTQEHIHKYIQDHTTILNEITN